MGGKGGGGGNGDTRVMFAEYIERVHAMVLDTTGTASVSWNILAAVDAIYCASPYAGATTLSPTAGFTAGADISTYPAVFDMFGKFMAGQDLEVLWTRLFDLSVNGVEVQDAIDAHSTSLQDEIDQKILPHFLGGMRDINAVMSTAFITGKALIYDGKLRAVSDFSTKLRLKQFDTAHARWEAHLNWNKTVSATYNDIMKMFYAATYDAEARTMEYRVKDTLWQVSLYDYVRAMLGALNGAAAAKPENQPSQTAKSIAGVAAGGAAGASIGSSISDGNGGSYAGLGAGVGGALGLAGSFA